MKKILLLFCFLSISSLIHAQLEPEAHQPLAENFDTLSIVQVGVGIRHLEITEYSSPYTIDVLEVDLTVPYNSVETVKANDRLAGYETTSSMASRKSTPGHIVVGAVNGDFYAGGGVPTNTQVIKGEVLKLPMNREVIGFDNNNKPIIEIVNYSGKLIYGDSSIAISNVNDTRGTNQLILYNSFKGTSTGTNDFGTEISVEPISPWFVNDTVRVVVENKIVNLGNMMIDSNSIVLSAHGTSAAFLNDLNINDTLKIVNNLTPGIAKLKEVIGGSERIIHNGINVGEWPEKHPRTAAGFSQDSTKLYLVTVDGRQSISAGMTLTELGEFMLQLGIYQAINLDGGGSTTMVVRNQIVNAPSDGPGVERAVANALLIISSAPQGSLNQIQMTPDFNKVFKGKSLQFKVNGWDEYYNPVSIESSQLQFSLSADFGTITQSGLFTAGDEADTGFVYVDYNGLKDTSFVIVKTIEKIILTPKNVLTDTTRKITFRTAAYDMDGITHQIPMNDYQWLSSNESVGKVDSVGNFFGKDEGTTIITASYGGYFDSAFVTVEVKEGVAQLDQLEDLSGWTIESENVNISVTNVTVSTDSLTEGSGSFKIDYEFIYDPTKLYWVYLKKDMPVSGVPEFLWIDAKSDGSQHHIIYELTDDNDELFRMNTNQYAQLTVFDSIQAVFANAAPVGQGTSFNYPVIIKQIGIKLGSTRQTGEVYNGTIYIDNLRVSHPSPLTSVADENNYPSGFKLFQNYPNPFNPVTNIKFNINKEGFIKLKIYDILGSEITTLLNKNMKAGEHIVAWDAAKLTSGTYFYTLNHDGEQVSKKMILIK